MIRRIFWFLSGATAGFGGAMWVRRRFLRAVERYVPEQVASDVSDSVRRFGGDLRDAVGAGRTEMRVREATLRAELRPGPGPTDEGGTLRKQAATRGETARRY